MYLPPSEFRFHPGGMAVSELARLISRRDPVILEVGANVGQTTEEFLTEMPEAKIFCFEPDPRAISQFKEKIASANVTLVESAVGDTDGFVTFHQSSGEGQARDWNQSGSIRNPKRHSETWPWIKFESQIQVPIVRLDDWARENRVDAIDLIWADAQGAESDLIAGGSETLKNCRFFYTEYGPIEWYEGQVSLNDICRMLFDLGLILVRKFQMDALFVNKRMHDLHRINFPIRRNASCPCGSGLRYKNCHGQHA